MPVTTPPSSSSVDGTWVPPNRPDIARYNPADPDQAVTTDQQADSAVSDSAIAAASTAGVEWASVGYPACGRILGAAAVLLPNGAKMITAKMTVGTGKPLSMARHSPFTGVEANWRGLSFSGIPRVRTSTCLGSVGQRGCAFA